MTPFDELKVATDYYYQNPTNENQKKAFETALAILRKNGISLRNRTENLPVQFNISIPKSRANCIVLGLRYLKLLDKTGKPFSEDHYLFEEGVVDVQKGNGKKLWLEERFPEYRGSHKRSIMSDVISLTGWKTYDGWRLGKWQTHTIKKKD